MEEDLKGFESGAHNRAKGNTAEEQAVRWLEAEGYVLVERNVRTDAGEIDAIARDGDTLCFIEIKARAGDAYGPAIAAVTPAKQRRIARAASLYLMLRDLRDVPCRFDVLGMDPSPSGWSYTLLRNAFEAG
ncbi:MAG: YraN family protein [Acidobacteriota bacterium]